MFKYFIILSLLFGTQTVNAANNHSNSSNPFKLCIEVIKGELLKFQGQWHQTIVPHSGWWVPHRLSLFGGNTAISMNSDKLVLDTPTGRRSFKRIGVNEYLQEKHNSGNVQMRLTVRSKSLIELDTMGESGIVFFSNPQENLWRKLSLQPLTTYSFSGQLSEPWNRIKNLNFEVTRRREVLVASTEDENLLYRFVAYDVDRGLFRLSTDLDIILELAGPHGFTIYDKNLEEPKAFYVAQSARSHRYNELQVALTTQEEIPQRSSVLTTGAYLSHKNALTPSAFLETELGELYLTVFHSKTQSTTMQISHAVDRQVYQAGEYLIQVLRDNTFRISHIDRPEDFTYYTRDIDKEHTGQIRNIPNGNFVMANKPTRAGLGKKAKLYIDEETTGGNDIKQLQIDLKSGGKIIMSFAHVSGEEVYQCVGDCSGVRLVPFGYVGFKLATSDPALDGLVFFKEGDLKVTELD